MRKFRQIRTELWPLIYVKISFPGSVLRVVMAGGMGTFSENLWVHFYGYRYGYFF